MDRYKKAIEKLEGFTEKEIKIMKTVRGVFIFSRTCHANSGIYTQQSQGKTLLEAIEAL